MTACPEKYRFSLCIGDDAMPTAVRPRTGGNENTGLLKLIAVICMIVDHVGAVFFPRVQEMRLIGRIAFPLFAWCLCVGACYTRSIWKYALRLLIVGALCQPVYYWAMRHEWYVLNIFFELLLALLAIAAIQKNRMGSRYWGPALALAASCALPLTSSYGWQGIVFILGLYACRYSRAALAAFMIGFCLFWGQTSVRLVSLFGVTLPETIPLLKYSSSLLSALFHSQTGALLALPLIVLPMNKRLRVPKWVIYGAYPLHLGVIAVIRNWNVVSAYLNQWL